MARGKRRRPARCDDQPGCRGPAAGNRDSARAENSSDVTPELMRHAQRVITFGCLDQCPRGAQGKSEDWPLPTAAGKTRHELHAIREESHDRITRLIASFRAQT